MNLKQKLTQTITQKKADSDLLSQISTLKSKLASQKSFNSAGYNKLSEIEHSLYRYNTFITGNLTKEADREAQRLSDMVKNLNDENFVLEVGINNSKYVWHTEPNACKECQELDGTIYYTKEDIPENLIQTANVRLKKFRWMKKRAIVQNSFNKSMKCLIKLISCGKL